MFLIGHIAYTSFFFMLIAKLLNIEYTMFHLFILMFFSIYPDLDYLFHALLHKGKIDTNAQHRKWFTHWPITYSPLLILLYFFPSLNLFLVCFGIYFHFVLDTFMSGDGMMWLYPFSRKFFSFFDKKTKGYHGVNWFKQYRKMLIYKVDLASFIILLVVLVVAVF